MKKTLLIIFCLFGLFGYSQDEYYRIVDWKFYPENVIQLTDSTYTTDAIPFDYNDQGAIQRVIGGYVVDFIGHRYEVIDSTSTTITVLDIYRTGQAPQTGQISRCYRSVYNGDSKYVGSIDYSPLDESARWKMNGSDNEILWRHGIDYEFPFKRLVLDTNYVHDGSEIKGTMAWEEATQSVETHIADDLHLNNGEELWVPLCVNTSGVDILNGQPVYINGASGSSPTIQLASNITYDESRLIGVATQNIPNGTSGRVARFGFVNEINLSGCTAGGDVYLGDKVLTHVRPMGGLFPVVIGKAIVCSVSGRLLVYPQSVEYTSEINNAYGWASYLQGEQTNISFVDATRAFTVSPTAPTFYFYQAGLKYIKTGAQTITISDIEGLHIIYYDLGVLSEMVNPSSSQIVDAIRNKVITSVIYWDATNKVSIYVSNERHTFHWPSWVHAYAHLSFGTQFGNGLALTNITLGIGSVDADAQFGSDSGTITDEDIVTSIPTVLSTTGIPLYYRLGSGLGNWRRVTRSGYAFLNDGTTGLAMYNLNSGGTWSIVSMTNNYYRLVHVFATNDIGDPNKIIAMSGVAQYSSAENAEAAVNNEILNIYNSNLPFAEVKHIGSLILHTKTGLGNTVNARYVAIPSKPSGANYYMDYRRSTIIDTGGGSGSGATTILGLSDTPASYAGQSNKVFGVNSGETGMEFKAVTATAAGTVNIPTGQQYQINGGSIVVDAINDGVTTTAPSQNAIFNAVALKENLSNKENTTVDNSSIKYPTVNLLKTYADTKEPAFTKNTGFNKNFGTTAGTVLEGRTFGTAANSATTDFAPASGSGNYVNVSPASAQSGNIWISGNAQFDSGITISSLSRGSGTTPLIFSDTNESVSERSWRFIQSQQAYGDFQLQQATTHLGSTFQSILRFNQTGEAFFNSAINATTARFSDLTDGYIPYHISDASGLGNSNIYTDGAFGVGINTSSPNYLNPIRGSLDLNGSEQALFSLSIGGIGKALFFHTGTDLLYTNEAAGNMGFNTNGARRATITQGGNFDVGYDGSRPEKFAVNGGAYLNTSLTVGDLSGTGTRLVTASSDGTFGATVVPIFNYTVQSLSGTNVSWNLANGKDATITLTGNTVITLSNAINGISGTLWVTNPSTVYTITFAGYVNSIDPFIRLSSNVVITSGSSKFDDYTFKYNGSKMNWNGTLDRH